MLRKELKQNNLHKQYIVINGKIWALKLHLLIKLKCESQRQKKILLSDKISNTIKIDDYALTKKQKNKSL